MNFKLLLKKESLEGFKVLFGTHLLNRKISSVNILEALDIENWAKEDMLILTSLFALKDENSENLENFVKKLSKIKVAGLLVKKDRLYNTIPKNLIDLCKKYELILIEIPRKASYEKITIDILKPVIKDNSEILDKYQKMTIVFNEINRLNLQLDEVLNYLKDFFVNDIILEKNDEIILSTNPSLNNYKIESFDLLDSNKYSFKAKKCNLSYENGYNEFAIFYSISFFDNENYNLIIHENIKEITDDDIFLYQTAVTYLQTELLKNYNYRSGQFLNTNSILNDIFTGNISDKYSLILALKNISMLKYDNYQVMEITINSDRMNEPFVNHFKNIRKKLKSINPNFAYYEKLNIMRILYNFDKTENFDFQKMKKIFNSYQEHCNISIFWTLSSVVEKEKIAEAFKQNMKMNKLFEDSKRNYFIYDELGIMKFFINFENQDSIMDYVQSKYKKLFLTNQELFDTLFVFLSTGKNYKLTSDYLHFHPKSIKYRIESINKYIDFDIDDWDECLEFLISAKLLNVFSKGEKDV